MFLIFNDSHTPHNFGAYAEMGLSPFQSTLCRKTTVAFRSIFITLASTRLFYFLFGWLGTAPTLFLRHDLIQALALVPGEMVSVSSWYQLSPAFMLTSTTCCSALLCFHTVLPSSCNLHHFISWSDFPILTVKRLTAKTAKQREWPWLGASRLTA